MSFWHSTGADELKQTAGPFDASTQSNGADWHLGVLRLPGNADKDGAEDWFFSGVYIEDGELTTKVGSGAAGAAPEKPAASAAAPSKVASSAAPAATSSKAAVAPASSSAAAVETPVASSTAAASSAAAPVETPAASSSAAAISSAAPVETPAASSTSAAAPVATPTAGAGSDAKLPEEFTISQFVAWLKAKTGKN